MRQHPIHIVENLFRYPVLLLLPTARIFLARYGIALWPDLLAMTVILTLWVLYWVRNTYRLTEDGIRIRRGLFFPTVQFFPYRQLTAVKLEEPFWLIPFRAVRLRADTDAGSARSPDVSLTLSRKQAAQFLNCISSCSTCPDHSVRFRGQQLMLLSYITSNSLSGVLFASTLISGVGQLLGQKFEEELVRHLTDAMRFLAFGLPPVAATAAFLLFGGWAVAFFANLVRYLGFQVTREGNRLQIRRGVLTRRRYWIAVDRIHLLELRQTLVTRLFGISSVFLHTSGYGKGKHELAVLIPSAGRKSLWKQLSRLISEFSFGPNQVQSGGRFRFLFAPLCLLLGVTMGWMWGYRQFPWFRSVILFVGLLAEVPCLWFLAVRSFALRHTGLSLQDGMLTCRFTRRYSLRTLSVPIERVVKLVLRQNLIQQISGNCDVVLWTVAEGRNRIVIPNLPVAEVIALFSL